MEGQEHVSCIARRYTVSWSTLVTGADNSRGFSLEELINTVLEREHFLFSETERTHLQHLGSLSCTLRLAALSNTQLSSQLWHQIALDISSFALHSDDGPSCTDFLTSKRNTRTNFMTIPLLASIHYVLHSHLPLVQVCSTTPRSYAVVELSDSHLKNRCH